jgi:hypothetical protein
VICIQNRSFLGEGNCRNPEKTTDLPQVTDKLYHLLLCTSPWVGFERTTSMVIGTDCIGSCKSNYHTITATTFHERLHDMAWYQLLLGHQRRKIFFYYNSTGLYWSLWNSETNLYYLKFHWNKHHNKHHSSRTTSMVIGTDCIGSCKSNYHTITATTFPLPFINFVFT